MSPAPEPLTENGRIVAERLTELAAFFSSEETVTQLATAATEGVDILDSPAVPVRCFYRDDRLPGRERIVYGDPRNLLRIPDEIRQSVCFIGTEDASGHVSLGGTVVVASVPLGRPYRFASYLITGRHCVAKASASGDKIVLRVNGRKEGVQVVDISKLTWDYPDNAASDIAVSELIGDGYKADLKVYPIDAAMILTQDESERVQLGLGEELICIGLFHHRQGDRRNIPIARFGNIAALPEEPLIDEWSGLEYDAFLAEIRSIGGLSGSPVFARLPAGRKDSNGTIVNTPQWFWLGVVRGHWTDPQVVSAEQQMMNTGIALVTPAWEALELLDRGDFVKERKEAEQTIRKSEAPTQDSVETDDEFSRFKILTHKLVHVPKNELDEKRKDEG